MAYKKDQGRVARMIAFWSAVLLLLYGCTSLRRELAVWFPGSLSRPLGYDENVMGSGMRLPVLGVELTPAFLIAAALFLGGAFLIYRWLDRPKNADLLIETESELRKVSWPTLPEAMNGSTVVILCVAFLMVFLAGADWVLGRWSVFLFGAGG
jgi:preprotein translocase SecE subunit